jgi:hypothetical protein
MLGSFTNPANPFRILGKHISKNTAVLCKSSILPYEMKQQIHIINFFEFNMKKQV